LKAKLKDLIFNKLKKKLSLIFLRLIGTLASFTYLYIITNQYETEEVGLFFIFFSIVNLGSKFSSGLYYQKIVKDISKNDTASEIEQELISVLSKSIIPLHIILLIICILVIFAWDFFSLKLIKIDSVSISQNMFILSFWLLSCIRCYSAILQGLFFAKTSILIEFVIIPVLFLFLLLTNYFSIIGSYFFSTLIVFLFIIGYHIKYIRLESFYSWKLITNEHLIFWSTTAINAAQNNFVMIASTFILTPSQIGVLGVLQRLINVINTMLSSLGSYYRPIFSKLYNSNNLILLKDKFLESQFFIILLSAPVLLIYFLFSERIGDVFNIDLDWFLKALAIIQMLCAIPGLSGQLLPMVGKELVLMRIFMVSSITLAICYPILGYYYSLLGFIISYFIYQFTRQTAFYFYALKIIK